MIWRSLLAFTAMAALDFVWARYIKATASHRPWLASSLAATLILLTGVTTIIYVSDPYMLIPTAAGAFVGTRLAMAFE